MNVFPLLKGLILATEYQKQTQGMKPDNSLYKTKECSWGVGGRG